MENGGRGEGDPRGTGERLVERAEEMKGRAQERLGDVRQRAEAGLEDARGYAQEAGAWISEFARERPIAAIAVAAGLGFLIGRIASRS
jgi:ElaB/YqjD/DUF883 family membrane-anchored ribosome-binding protein